MAVEVDRPALAVELRLITSTADYGGLTDGERCVLGRVCEAATALVERFAPAAPEGVKREAVARVSGWLYDSAPHEGRGVTSPLHYSGAAALLARWRSRRLVG